VGAVGEAGDVGEGAEAGDVEEEGEGGECRNLCSDQDASQVLTLDFIQCCIFFRNILCNLSSAISCIDMAS